MGDITGPCILVAAHKHPDRDEWVTERAQAEADESGLLLGAYLGREDALGSRQTADLCCHVFAAFDLEAIRRHERAAEPGPWTAHPDGLVWSQRLGDPVSGSALVENAEFIAAARTAVPALLAKAEHLKIMADAVRGVWRLAAQWRGHDDTEPLASDIFTALSPLVAWEDEHLPADMATVPGDTNAEGIHG